MAFEILSSKTNENESALMAREKKGITFDPSTLTPPFLTTALIELSNWCNHACVFCTNPRMERKKGFLELSTFERFVKEAVSLGLQEVGLYTTGEPFFTKNLDEFVRTAKSAGARYVYLTTNGALATPERVKTVIDAGLSSIKFSVNAGTAETYKLVHGKDDFKKVLEHIRFVSEYRKTNAPKLKIFASCVVTKFSEPEKENLKRELLPLIDDLAFYGVGGQAGQSLEQLDWLESTMTDPMPEAGKASPCYMLWNRLHLTWQGYLTLCCIDYEDALTYADFNDTSLSLKQAWQNQVFQEMRRRHQTQELSGTLCQNCLYGTKEKVYPITAIGHPEAEKPIVSLNKEGVRSVKNRIETLANRNEGNLNHDI